MTETKKWRFILAGAAAGGVNGILGAGGGPLLVPLLVLFCRLDEKKALATSLAVMLPLCAVSAAARFVSGEVLPQGTLLYLAGGLVGGTAGGMLIKRIPSAALMRIFGAIMIVSGIRTVFF